MRIDVIVYDGFDELDAVGPYEVFHHASDAGADLDIGYAAVDRAAGDRVSAAHGTNLEVQRALGAADVIVVPGGGWQNAGDVAGARAEALRGVIPRALAERHASGALIAGVCTGSLLVADAGLLRGRRAVTHHSSIDDLPGYGATVVRERVVDEGDVVTAGGVTSGIDLALHLVERLCGATYADHAARQMEHHRILAGAPSD